MLFVYLAAPVAISGFVGVALLPRITGGRHRLRPMPATARAAVRYSFVNYISTLAYQAPYFALPVIVLVNVDAATNSSFYVAWGSRGDRVLRPLGDRPGTPGRRGQGRRPTALAGPPGRSCSRSALMGAGTVATFLGKGVITAAYGEAYHDAARILPAMMLAGIPWAMTSLYLTEVRVMHRHVATVVITVTLTLAIIVPALILVPGQGPSHGLNAATRRVAVRQRVRRHRGHDRHLESAGNGPARGCPSSTRSSAATKQANRSRSEAPGPSVRHAMALRTVRVASHEAPA